MRVIAGTARGLKLLAPQAEVVRPTADRMKECLFNMLQSQMPCERFLDVFSGSGAIGIEALSRGAQQAVFIEQDKRCAQTIVQNLEKARMLQKSRVFTEDYASALARCGQEGLQFHIIFLDPPYGQGFLEKALAKIVAYHLLQPGGLIVAEQSTTEAAPEVSGLTLLKQKSYKTTTFAFLEAER